MPKAAHHEAAEHHEKAAKAHRTAAEHHDKGDHETAHKHATEAHGHSTKAHETATKAHSTSAEHAKKSRADCRTGRRVEARRPFSCLPTAHTSSRRASTASARIMELKLAAMAAAVLVMALVLQDAFEVMLLPRRVIRRIRITRFFFRFSWFVWTGLARAARPGPGRERLLSVFGPLSMVVLFAFWAALLIAAFGVLEWGLQPRGHPSPIAEQLYMSGVTFFTLGYGDVVPHGLPARALAVVEAGTGLGFLALVIGYLPVLYQLFSRREAHVIRLDVRAGTPPTAVTLLSRHADGGLEKLDVLLDDWEQWGAVLLESHLSYPMLVFYRSQHDNQSWLTGMAAVMDACALILVGVSDMHPLQARMTFTMARQVIVEMARSFAVEPSRYDGGDRLPEDGYEQIVARLTEAGLHWDAGPGGRETLAALRATYEPLLDGLARRLMLQLPNWMPDNDASDNWQSGHRGLIASRLVEQLADRGAAPPDTLDGSGSLAQKLRARLKA